MDFLSLYDLEINARGRPDAATADYFAGGANDEITLRANRQAFDDLAIRFRILVDVAKRDPSTVLLGRPSPLPILLAPVGFQGLAHPEGELATARAAATFGIPMVLSTFSTTPLEEVRAAAPGRRWFQLYVHKERPLTQSIVERAERAGFECIVLTVDVPVLGRRERDLRNNFVLPPHLRLGNFEQRETADFCDFKTESGLASFHRGLREPGFTWKDLEWLATITTLPLLLKGVVRADDARKALDHGVGGIIVSNHGGRQLDTAIPSLRALPDISEAVGDRTDVLMDGGVRRGTDIIKAIALGAKAVLIGRPIVWGLAVGGQAGVERALELLRDELDTAMALAGTPTLASMTRDLIS